MKKLKCLIGIFVFVLFSKSSFSGNMALINSRCSEDSLELEDAFGRMKWALKCGHINQRDFNFDVYIDDANTSINPRAKYITFLNSDYSEFWKAPVKESAPCITPPSEFTNIVTCVSGCYTPDQIVDFPGGARPIGEAAKEKLPQITVLDKSSTLDSLLFTAVPVDSYTEDVVPSLQDILVFETEHGRQLKVTPNHPLIDGTGHMREAFELKAGEDLIGEDALKDKIMSINPIKYFGRVYNVTPNSEKLLENVVIAQGLLTGSNFYQNDGIIYLNRILLRKSIKGSEL